VSAFKLVSYVLDPNGREWLPIETFIGAADKLERELTSLIKGQPIVVELFAPNGDLLNLGIGGQVGYAAFATQDMAREGRPPMRPVGTVGEDVPEWVEFEMGDTPTPIGRRYLVRASELISIVTYFFETGELHPEFTWE
jgi:hypothetical protein